MKNMNIYINEVEKMNFVQCLSVNKINFLFYQHISQ